jgi:hypothetical protein
MEYEIYMIPQRDPGQYESAEFHKDISIECQYSTALSTLSVFVALPRSNASPFCFLNMIMAGRKIDPGCYQYAI